MSSLLFKNDTANIKSATALVGKHTVTSAGATANTLSIDLSGDLAAIDGHLIQVLDSGDRVVTSDADVTASGGTLTVADGASFNLTAGYIIHYIVFGSLEN